MSNTFISKNEKVIDDLKSRVAEIKYADIQSRSIKTKKVSKSSLWQKAQKVSKHLGDDSLLPPTPARP